LRPVVQGVKAAASLGAPLGGYGLVLIQVLTDWDAPVEIWLPRPHGGSLTCGILVLLVQLLVQFLDVTHEILNLLVVIGIHLESRSEIIFIVKDPTVCAIFAVPVRGREPCHYVPHFLGESAVWVSEVILVLTWRRGGPLLLPIARLVNHGRTLDLLELGLEDRERLIKSAFGDAGLGRG